MLINTTMSGNLNYQALAAISLVVATFIACMSFCWGALIAVLITLANDKGKNVSNSEQGITLTSGLFLAVLLSLPIMFIFKNIEPVWLFFGQDPQVTKIGQSFFAGGYTIAAAELMKYVILKFLIVLNKLRLAILANLSILPLMVLCNNLLLKGYWGLPELGLYGLGLGTAIAYWIVLLGLIVYLVCSPEFKEYFSKWHAKEIYRNRLISITKLGIPIGLMFSLENSFFFIVAILMGKLSVIALAAYQLVMQYVLVCTMFSASLSEVASILAGKAYGAKNFAGVVRTLFIMTCFSCVCLSILAALYWLAPHSLISTTLSTEEMSNQILINLAISFFGFAALFQILDSTRLILSGILRAMLDSVYPMIISILSFWVIGIAVGAFCAFVLNWQGVGLWIGLISAVTVCSGLLYLRFRKNLKVLISTPLISI